MFILPNGKKLDEEEICFVMENSDPEAQSFLDAKTGEVIMISEIFDENADERLDSLDSEPGRYFVVPQILSREQYKWMEEFAKEMVFMKDPNLAQRLEDALNGKGAFRRFKDVLDDAENGWMDAWHQWKNDYIYREMIEWLASLPLDIKEDMELDDDCALCQTLNDRETKFKILQEKFREMRKHLN